MKKIIKGLVTTAAIACSIPAMASENSDQPYLNLYISNTAEQVISLAGIPHIKVKPLQTAGIPHIKVKPLQTAGIPHIKVKPLQTAGIPHIKVKPLQTAGIPHIKVK
ncbi:hypothetical protein L2755_14200, partial [Shewanella abyssi]|uniref:hypothetical protein n=1 Tax=Shewanella abyssi TaxID=311789 RepID=UPI00200CD7E3